MAAFFLFGLGIGRTEGKDGALEMNVLGVFSTHTARFLLNDCDGLIFCTIFADDGNDKA